MSRPTLTPPSTVVCSNISKSTSKRGMGNVLSQLQDITSTKNQLLVGGFVLSTAFDRWLGLPVMALGALTYADELGYIPVMHLPWSKKTEAMNLADVKWHDWWNQLMIALGYAQRGKVQQADGSYATHYSMNPGGKYEGYKVGDDSAKVKINPHDLQDKTTNDNIPTSMKQFGEDVPNKVSNMSKDEMNDLLNNMSEWESDSSIPNFWHHSGPKYFAEDSSGIVPVPFDKPTNLHPDRPVVVRTDAEMQAMMTKLMSSLARNTF